LYQFESGFGKIKFHCQICSLSKGNDKFYRFWLIARFHVFLHEIVGRFNHWRTKGVKPELPGKDINKKEFTELKDLRDIILKTRTDEIYYSPDKYNKLKQQFVNYTSESCLWRKNILEENFIFKGTTIICDHV